MFLFSLFYIIHYNASLLVSQEILPRSGLSATSSCNSQYYLYLLYVRTSLCKSSIVYKSIALWNALPAELKKLSSFKSFKHQFFSYSSIEIRTVIKI